jgi:hypothetical protein
MTESASHLSFDEAETKAMLERIGNLYREAHDLERAYMPVKPWHEHAAFDDIDAARVDITRARDALSGISALLQPESAAGNEQLNMARRADACAVFNYFAECLIEPLGVIESASFRLQQDLRTAQT